MSDEGLQAFAKARASNIKTVKELAIKHNRCKEQIEGKCMYPHCGCLHGTNGPIDPVTGKEMEWTE